MEGTVTLMDHIVWWQVVLSPTWIFQMFLNKPMDLRKKIPCKFKPVTTSNMLEMSILHLKLVIPQKIPVFTKLGMQRFNNHFTVACASSTYLRFWMPSTPIGNGKKSQQRQSDGSRGSWYTATESLQRTTRSNNVFGPMGIPSKRQSFQYQLLM